MGGSYKPGAGMQVALTILIAGFWYFTGILNRINTEIPVQVLYAALTLIPGLLLAIPARRLFDKLDDSIGFSKAQIIDRGCLIISLALFLIVKMYGMNK